mmetsp:Transcript_16796/g.47069  ORF Transcript_16796/g.47069 Transcript_16796/m.47069 type:complete len:254 (-) Transcript_16796:411-1172(-)
MDAPGECHRRRTKFPECIGRRCDRRDDDLLLCELEQFTGCQYFGGRDDVVGIVGRFAHAHEDDVGDVGQPVQAADLLGVEHLRQDFVGVEAAQPSHASCGAECASLPTANLRTNAQRRALSLPRNDHGLHLQSILQFQQQLGRGVGRTRNMTQFGNSTFDHATGCRVATGQPFEGFGAQRLPSARGWQHVLYGFEVVISQPNDGTEEVGRINANGVAVPCDLGASFAAQHPCEFIDLHGDCAFGQELLGGGCF